MMMMFLLQAFMSDDPPPKPRNTWMNDNEVGQDPRRVPKRRSTVMGINAGEEATEHGRTFVSQDCQ